VRELRDPDGRMPYRLWYEASEIDAIMEDELRRSEIERISGSAVDVDAFTENYLGITPQFVPLPRGVQGATDFFADGTVKMRISEALSERAANDEAGAERLIRTTLAHETAHVLLHRILFLQQSEALFGRQTSRRELCRDVPMKVPKGWVQKKCHETETQLGVATRETTEDPQVTQDQHVTRDETLH
jgi:hypothetical protein